MYRSRIAAKKIETESTTIKETSYPHEEWDAIFRKQTALRALSLLFKFGDRLPARVKVDHMVNTRSSTMTPPDIIQMMEVPGT